MLRNKLLINLSIYSIISIIILFFSYQYIQKKEQILLNQTHTTISEELKRSAQTLMHDKKNATLGLALVLSKSPLLHDALLSKDTSKLKFDQLSSELKNKTKFKNVWFHLINAQGISLYKSWNDMKNNSAIYREDCPKNHQREKIPNYY